MHPLLVSLRKTEGDRQHNAQEIGAHDIMEVAIVSARGIPEQCWLEIHSVVRSWRAVSKKDVPATEQWCCVGKGKLPVQNAVSVSFEAPAQHQGELLRSSLEMLFSTRNSRIISSNPKICVDLVCVVRPSCTKKRIMTDIMAWSYIPWAFWSVAAILSKECCIVFEEQTPSAEECK